jgi:hypothetical protein
MHPQVSAQGINYATPPDGWWNPPVYQQPSGNYQQPYVAPSYWDGSYGMGGWAGALPNAAQPPMTTGFVTGWAEQAGPVAHPGYQAEEYGGTGREAVEQTFSAAEEGGDPVSVETLGFHQL